HENGRDGRFGRYVCSRVACSSDRASWATSHLTPTLHSSVPRKTSHSVDIMKMRKLSSLLVGLLCLNVAMPSGAVAQQQPQKAEASNLNELLKGLFGPTWNIFLMGGATTTGRFLLQRPTTTNGTILGEQTLK